MSTASLKCYKEVVFTPPNPFRFGSEVYHKTLTDNWNTIFLTAEQYI